MIGLWIIGALALVVIGVLVFQKWEARRRHRRPEPLDHYCVHRVLENGERISFMMAGKPRVDRAD